MSTPDARLSAAERAAIADIEAAAAASDPYLAARLRGGVPSRLRPLLRQARFVLAKVWARVVVGRWWGVPLVLVGLLLMVVGLSSGIALSGVGAAVAAVGLRMLAEMIRVRLAARRSGA